MRGTNTTNPSLVKVWDYHAKSCVQTLSSHTANVSFAIFHPSLPLIVSGSEDGTIKLWHSSTYRLENTLNYNLERAWCVAYKKAGNEIAVGFDEGAVVVKVGYRSHPMYNCGTNSSSAATSHQCRWTRPERSSTPATLKSSPPT